MNSDSLTLRTIGSAKNPLAGFARSIYRVITGQKIEVYLTHLNNQGEFRSKKSQKENEIHIFPNPISDEGFSVYIKDINEHELYEVKVFDQLGLNVYSGVLTKNVTQIQGFLKSGVYFVDITINGLSVSKQKLIKS